MKSPLLVDIARAVTSKRVENYAKRDVQVGPGVLMLSFLHGRNEKAAKLKSLIV